LAKRAQGGSTPTADASGVGGEQLALLDDYFQQWLYGTVRPTILPEDFD
jgi:hypothetical protein